MASPVTNPNPPAGQPRTRWAILQDAPLIVLALALAALYFARPVLIPLAMAISLNFLLTPAVMQLERMRIRRVPAVLLVLAMAATIAVCVGWILARQVVGVINDLPIYRYNIDDKLASLRTPSAGGPLSRTVNSIHELGQEISEESHPLPTPNEPGELRSRREREMAREQAAKTPQPVVVVPPSQTTTEYMKQYARPVLEPIGVLAMVVIFTFYMLIKREDMRNRLLLLAGRSQLNIMTQALNEAAGRISKYLITNVLMNAGYGVIFAFGLYLLHVPNATLWGALMAILRMIPYAGTMIAGLSTLAFTLAVFNNWWHPLWVLLLFAGLEFVIANFVEPHIYGKRTGISAFALVVMAIVWTLLWGWPGLIVSTPMTVCLIVMGRYVPQMSFLHILLGEDAELSPEAHFYERLLAMDQAEAHEVADEFLKEHTLVELYDRVVLPALALSEQDRHKGAMDEVHSAWLYQSATELVAELTEYKTLLNKAAAAEAAMNGEAAQGYTSPVVCIPAEDQADEIAATMLAQLLEQSGHSTMLLSPSAMTGEILERLAEDSQTIVCISALPPFAFAQARRLAQTLRKNLPNNPIVVGLWSGDGDAETLQQRFGSVSNAIVTTLEGAVQEVSELDGRAASRRVADRRTQEREPGYTVF